MHRILLLLALVAASPAAAQTTISLGLRGGANRASTTTDPAGKQTTSYPTTYTTDKAALLAWQAGAVVEVRFGKLALQPALLFTQKGERLRYSFSSSGFAGSYGYELASTTRTNWLELPLNVVYTLHGTHGLQLLAGPYVALGVGGREKGTTVYTGSGPLYDPLGPTTFSNAVAYGDSTYNRRFDAGLNLGVGYRRGPVQVQLSYGLGLVNLHRSPPYPAVRLFPRDYAADAAYNRVLQLTGTYFFKL